MGDMLNIWKCLGVGIGEEVIPGVATPYVWVMILDLAPDAKWKPLLNGSFVLEATPGGPVS